MRAQRGAGIGLMIILLLAIGMVAVLAVYSLNRLTGARDEAATTQRRLARAVDAIDQFASTGQRLPCPARPDTDDGVEVQAGVATCTYPEGTLPWRTLGMSHDEGYDGWARKLSYRVYTGNQGSFTQPGGVSMVECDTVDGAPGGTTASAGGVGGLCRSNADIYQRNTTPAQFMAGKGVTLADMGNNYTDVAYVVLSHGSTGLGAYTISGVRLDLPTGDERNNTQASGPFTIRAFSDPDTSATNAQHFDDYVAYRRIEDLAKRAGLAARDWPEGATFNANTMTAATGSGAYRDNVGGNFSFMGNTYRATGGTGSFSFTTSGGMEGIGIAGGSNNLINDAEVVRVELATPASRAAFTLANFGKLFTVFREQVKLRFYDSSNAQIGGVAGAVTKQGCSDDGGAATFIVDPPIPGATFKYVELEGERTTDFFSFSFDSGFLLSEFAACAAGVACDTTLATSQNRCFAAKITSAAFVPDTITRPASSVLTFTLVNGTDNAAQDGIAFIDRLPQGLTLANTVVGGTCGGAVSAIVNSSVTPPVTTITLTGLAIGNNQAGCTVSVNVTATGAGSYAQDAASITTTSNLASVAASATLTIQ